MISLQRLHNNPRSLRIGDISFFEDRERDFKTQDSFGRWLTDQQWFKPFTKGDNFGEIPDNEVNDLTLSALYLLRLTNDYIDKRNKGVDPDWLKFVPIEIYRRLEYEYVIHGAPDQYKIGGAQPYSGFGFVAFEDGIVEETDEALCLGRLNCIRQLASLHDPTVTSSAPHESPMPFDHSRYMHSISVCAFTTLIGKRCELDENEFDTLRIAGQSHDGLTPAGGDSIKAVDPEGLDEDAHYPEILKREGWLKLRDKRNISEPNLVATISGTGLKREILDIADKLEYVGRDLFWFLWHNPHGHAAWSDFPETYDRITSILKVNRYPCSIWECSQKYKDQLIFTDKERLADFLRIRALMFKILYNNASARFREAGFVALVAKVLYEDGILTRDMLLKMADEHLFNLMGRELGIGEDYIMHDITHREKPRLEIFATAEEALNFEKEMAKDEPNTMTHMDVAPKPSVGCLKTLKVLEKGKVIPFDEAFPFAAWDVKRIFRDRNPYRVFMYDLGKLCRNEKIKKRLMVSRDKRIAT